MVRPSKIFLFIALTFSSMANLFAQPPTRAEAFYYEGYYLQKQSNDLRSALAAYQLALESNAPPELKAKINVQVDAIKTQLVAADLARLMPSDTMAYFEITEPGQHIRQLAGAMGLLASDSYSSDSSKRVLLQLEDGLVLPSDFKISPQLLAEVGKLRGAAVAITDVDFEQGEPRGVAVVHLGDSNLLGGLVETGLQVVPREQSISGYETFRIENKLWVSRIGNLLVASPERKQIKAAIERLRTNGPSLASDNKFRGQQRSRSNALAFAFVDGPRVLAKAAPHMHDELAVARAALDLDHLDHVLLSIGATDNGLAADASVSFQDGHQSLAYGLIRTPQVDEEAFRRIPSGMAVVGVMGMNPMIRGLAPTDADLQNVTAMDIGRELFANIRQIAAFIPPTRAAKQTPNFGFVVTAHDARQSEHLWTHLLSIPEKMSPENGIRVQSVDLNGHEARQIELLGGDAPQFCVVRLDKQSFAMGTTAAVLAATKTNGDNSIIQDAEMRELVSQASQNANKAISAHVGRLLQLAAAMSSNDQAPHLAELVQVLSDMRLSIHSHEAPSKLTLRLEASGMPQFENIVKTAAGIQGNASTTSAHSP